MKQKILLSSLFAILFFSASAQISMPFSPIQDNSIYSENVNNSNGQGNLYAGRNCNSDLRRALMLYDFTSIPAGSVITSVSLSLTVDNVSPSAPPSSVFTLHNVNMLWGEGASMGGGSGAPAVAPDATWNDAMFGTTPWTTQGGDFVAMPSASQNLTNSLGTFNWSGNGLINDVQGWVNNPLSNKGWILLGDETVDCTARRFGSSDVGAGPNLIVDYMCAMPPTANCQNFTAYINSNGFYVTQSSDLDNGSFSDCGAPLIFDVINPTLTCSQTPSNANSLIISAVYDGPLPGGNPKGIELYVINDIADLSAYGVGSANNGGGTDGEEFTLPAGSATAGSYIYITNNAAGFQSWFGFAADYTSSAMSVNGDDAIELFHNGTVIDVFGDINTDGTGQPWEYLDGWAKRNNLQVLNNGTFNDANWTYSGINALDGETDNTTAATPVPVGVFTTPSNLGINTTLQVTDLSNNMTSSCISVITVLDTISPTVNCIGGTPSFNLDANGNFTLQVSDIDNNSTDNCGFDSLYLSQTSFTCSNIGTNSVTLYGVDLSGNSSSCTMDIVINGSGIVVVDSVTSPPTSCNGVCDATLTIYATNATSYTIDNGITSQASNVFNNLCAGIYNIEVSNAGGCSDFYVQTILEPSPIFVTYNNTPPSCVCDGQIEIIANGGTPGYQYSIDGGATSSNSDTFTNLCGGIYNLTVTDMNGCTDVTNVTTNLPGANAIDVTTTQTGAVMSANATNVQYQWINCANNTPINGETGQFYTAVQNGDYAVIVTSGNCSDTSACMQVTGLGLNSNTIDISIYPNPSTGLITVKLNTTSNLISVIDINGKVVKTSKNSNLITTLDLSEFENGIYFIKVKTENKVITKKISLIK